MLGQASRLLLARLAGCGGAAGTAASAAAAAAAPPALLQRPWATAAGQRQQLAERWVSHSQATCSDGGSGECAGGGPYQQQQQPEAQPEGADPEMPPPQPELVEQYLSPTLMNRKQLLHHRKADIVRQFQRFSGDTGSPEVQVAVLTERIRDMMEHFKDHRKDYHSMRGLQAMLNQRRKLLAYLRRDDFEAFCYVIHRLGLRDNNYARQARYDKYRVGSRLGAPAEPIKRYGFR